MIPPHLFPHQRQRKTGPEPQRCQGRFFALDISEHRARLARPLVGRAFEKNRPMI
jgi:hypothetical protein